MSEPHPCGTSPCIDPVFGPTGFSTFIHWTATTDASNVNHAWGVSFGNGEQISNDKNDGLRARAVRGGL